MRQCPRYHGMTNSRVSPRQQAAFGAALPCGLTLAIRRGSWILFAAPDYRHFPVLSSIASSSSNSPISPDDDDDADYVDPFS
ncbi:hypothetical protein BDZ89DRAFT_1087453 [Hymenopellis radicata]|nr:hypothetical protein BDZ89DRAFT_1087453 [Hymenopellis radicata]